MRFNDKKWQSKPERGVGADRDGKKFDKRGNKNYRNSSSKFNRNEDDQDSIAFDDRSKAFKPRFSQEKPFDGKASGNRRKAEDRRFRPILTSQIRNQKGDEEEVYNPHAKYTKKKQLEYGKRMIDLSKPMRLNKFIANAGFCSRREADDYIKAGVVTVNGEVVTEMGAKVVPDKDKVLFHDQLVRSEKRVYILLNKPKDCVTTTEDTNARITVMDLVKDACEERIYPVGRLDRNTTGLLLLTNDGDLAAKLMHPKFQKRKIYHAVLDKPLLLSDMQKISDGITLEDGEIKADDISYVEEDDKKQVGIEIHSGRNRIVRRIFEHLGYKVVRLDRVYFAGLTKKNLPRGKFRRLTEQEINMLRMGCF